MVARFPPFDHFPDKGNEGAYPGSVEKQLRGVCNVTSNVVQQALDVWSELWAELDGQVVAGTLVLPQEQSGHAPARGWPDFLEKMWLLRHYLDYAKRFTDGR
jgi:hypothetical protein